MSYKIIRTKDELKKVIENIKEEVKSKKYTSYKVVLEFVISTDPLKSRLNIIIENLGIKAYRYYVLDYKELYEDETIKELVNFLENNAVKKFNMTFALNREVKEYYFY